MRKFLEKKYEILLLAIVLFGAILRIVLLGDYPSGFFRDESGIGYNAYSIWKTGKDEYGIFLPIVFRSYEVFFLPAYMYLAAPIVGIFGLTEFNTRIILAIFGIIDIILVYFIAKEIWNNKEISLLSSFLLAISPWHIFFSRGAFDAHLALTFFGVGFLFWLKFIKKLEIKFILISAIFFSFAVYSYQAGRLISPSFFLIALFLMRRQLLKIKSKLVIPILVVILLLSPLLSVSFQAAGLHRPLGVTIFSQNRNPPGWIDGREEGFFINNEFFLRSRQILALYLSYYSPFNLFFEGDYDRQRSVENFSVFYFWMFPFLFLGFFNLIKNFNLKGKSFLIWILLGPLPASFTSDPFQTHRSLLFFTPLTILIAVGVFQSFTLLKKYSFVVRFFLILISLISLIFYLYSYFILNPSLRGKYWDYGYKELIAKIADLPGGTSVVLNDNFTSPYIHYLFFNQISPKKYHGEVEKLGPPQEYYFINPQKIRPEKIGNIEFRQIVWKEDIYKNQVLVGNNLAISEEQEKEHFLTKIFEIHDISSNVIFQGYNTNPKKKCFYTKNASELCKLVW